MDCGVKVFSYLLIIIQIEVVVCTAIPVRSCAKLYNSLSPQAYTLSSVEEEAEDASKSEFEDTLVENTTYTGIEYCTSNFCYSLWREDDNGTIQVMGQGCWVSSDKRASCLRDKCVSDGPSTRALSDTRFCCCSGNLCNMNMSTNAVVITTTPLLPITPVKSDINLDNLTVYVSIILATILFLIIVSFIIYKYNENEVTTTIIPAGPGYSSNLYNVDNLKLVSMVGKGRYGTVWRGLINEEPVAVKIFPAHHRNYFLNERDLYCLPMMSNPSLLSYYGCDERSTMDGVPEYLLVLSLASGGCLQDYLKEHVLTWDVYCSMAKSVAHGIAHLHTDTKKGDLVKPCICHRDINSRNILVKSDLTCCICDLGFAVKTWGPRYEHNGEQQLAETRSINEVGTLRYMSPEILEGAVNLRDCESALKQIDIYALGLVLWELNTRCSDFYPAGQEVPEYRVPYEKELPHPTFEQMQVMVCRHKARPLFPAGWGDRSTPASKLAKETCEDCWDHDAEARLTALCVEERLSELSSMRPNRYTNIIHSPPLNTNNLCTTKNLVNENVTDFQLDKNTNAYPQIHAFQGRNPCLERNLMTDSFSETSVLIDKSLKHQAMENFNTNILLSNNHDISVRENSSTNYIQHNTGQNDTQSTQRNNAEDTEGTHQNMTNQTATPIPYLQNVVSDENKSISIPKDTRNKSMWRSIKNLFERNKLNLKYVSNQNGSNEKSNLVYNSNMKSEVESQNNFRSDKGEFKTSLIMSKENLVDSWSPKIRPNSLPLDSLQKLADNNYLIIGDDELLNKNYAIITKPMHSSSKQNLSRQHSLEVFHEVFSSTGDLGRLRDPSQRIKTPGDVPPSVRRARGRRGSNRLSLYDDRMMVTVGHSL